MKFNENHSKSYRLSDDDKEFLRTYIPKNERAIQLFTKFLETYTAEQRVNTDEPNWAIKRAMKDGKEQLIGSWKLLFKD